MRKLIYFLVFQAFCGNILAQSGNNIAVGTWRVHAPYQVMNHLAVGDNGIVYSCSPAGIMYGDGNDATGHALSTLDGLASNEYSTLAYDRTTSSLVIGYKDGNIDILRNNTIINLNDIARSSTIVGSKQINHIFIDNGTAYLSAEYGVSLLNLASLNIEETWKNLSSGGIPNAVYGSTITTDHDSVFLATKNGILSAKLSPGINLMDFTNWKSYNASEGVPAGNKLGVASYNGLTYAIIDQQGLYVLAGTQWTLSATPLTATSSIRKIRTNSSSGIIVCADDYALLISQPGTHSYIVSPGFSAKPGDCDYDGRGNYWVADLGFGLWSNGPALGFKMYSLNGPFYNSHFKLNYYNNNMLSVAGAYDKLVYQPTYNSSGYYEFVNNEAWKSYEYFYNGQDSRDLIDAQYMPDGSVYIASYRQGLYKRSASGTYTLFDHTNSNLVETTPGNLETRVAGLAIDSKANLWLSNQGTVGTPTVHRISPTGTWTSYTLNDAIANSVGEITIDKKDNKWIILNSGNGILVYNETSSPSKRYINTSSGSLPSMFVYTLAYDKDGHMWAGTDKGVAVLYNASNYLSSPSNFTQPIYAGFPLLFDRVIYDIEVDGANRKWIGTDNGIWLMNEDCSKIIATFNTSNSKLLSDYILDIEINDLTGEVFIATSKGLISYRADATESSATLSNVKVFPNPVKPGYNGFLTISGLMENSSVKITDITGQLVFQDQSNGGTVSWNLIDYTGNKISTGVYLVFIADEQGVEKQMTQFAVVE